MAKSESKYSDALNLTYQLESNAGKDKSAYQYKKGKALGGYQLTEGALKSLQASFPKKWSTVSFMDLKNDNVGREAAKDYYTLLQDELVSRRVAPTRDALLAAYHSGVPNMLSPEGLGPEGKTYLRRAWMFAGPSPEATAFDPEGVGYDMDMARVQGSKQGANKHWPSLAPMDKFTTDALGFPLDSSLVLKGRKHPTWDLMMQEEKKLGRKVIKRGSRYYSIVGGE